MKTVAVGLRFPSYTKVGAYSCRLDCTVGGGHPSTVILLDCTAVESGYACFHNIQL